MEKEGKPSELRLEEKRRRIRNLVDDFLNGLKKIKNEEEVFIYSKWDGIKELRMEVRLLRTFVLFGDSSLDDDFYYWMSKKINKFSVMTRRLLNDEVILEKYNMDSLVPLLLEEIQSYLSLKNDNYVAMTTEEKMFEYLFTNLHDLPIKISYLDDDFICRMSEKINILLQVFRRLTDFYPILLANKTTTTQYLFLPFQVIADRVMRFYFRIWNGKYKLYKHSHCSSKITSLLIDIIPLELEVLYISTSKLIKESTSRELKQFVKQIVKASPRILQNRLIHLQGRMAGAVNYAPTQSINVMIEFLLIFLTDIPKRFIHPDKLNDMLAHVGLLTRKISILMEESSENNINEADFSAPDLLQEIERMRGDIKQNFLKSPDESSQLRFPMDDGFLFTNLLLRHLNDLLISDAYSVSLIKKEIGMVKESLEFIRSSFKKVRQTLDDSTSGVVKDCWLRALDVAYEAEHVINSILVRDKALSHLLFSLPNVTNKIKLIVAEVTCLQLEDKNGDDPLDAKSSYEPIESTSSSFVEVTVGHEEDEFKMIDQLLHKHESELDVISIVGMPGLGKTTLAKKVYNNTLVASHFNVRAWCTVSHKYNKSKVLREILQQVTDSGGKESEDDLADKLRVALYDKRYLIVLDDVWDIATGEMLIACFPKVERGNRVILTSRSSEVGLKVKCHSDLLRLQLLTLGESWKLFEKMVFGKGSCPAELLDVGHQIVEKCQGLPLAVVLIAGVIVRGKKKEKDLWLKIQHNLDSFVSANNNLEIMQLSYDHLPDHLKPLLLYFARSRKSKRTPVSKLMQLWMAEGFVDHDILSKCSLEEATQRYLDALVSSSLIMVDHMLYNKNMTFSVRIKVCYVHDVVHDFCLVKAKKEKFLKLMNPGARFHTSDFLHHRLTIHTENGQLHKKCVLFNSKKCSAGSKHLISLKVSGSPLNLLQYDCHTRPFGLVRVLQLDNIVLDDSLMEEIGSLFHLRFLRIHTRDVKAIPVSWLNLQNLETLLINTLPYYTMVLLPRILKLSKLKHVKIDRSCFFEEEGEEDNIQSRILEGENSKLTTLSHVYISYSEGTNDALKKFPNLQHLQCTIKEPTNPPTHGDWFPKFYVLNKLESLFVKYYNVWIDDVFPNEYHFPSSLKELRLDNFVMRPALLSAITALPQLEILEIKCSDFVEYKWDASEDIYQSLKTLRLENTELSEWEVDRETFPKLEELILEHCDMLTEIPCAFADIETLKSIHLMSMNREVEDSAIEIKKQIIDFAGEDRLQVHLSGVLYELEAEEEDQTELPFEEERRRINNHIDDFLNGLNKIKNEKIIASSKLDDIEKLRMELRFLSTFVLFGNSSLDYFYSSMSEKIDKFDELSCSLFYQDEDDKLILAKCDMECLAPLLLEEMKSYFLSLENDYYVAMTTEGKMFQYLFRHLHDLPNYRANLLLPWMSDFKILQQVFRHLRDFYPILKANKAHTEYLYPWLQLTDDRVTQFCFDLWTGEYKRYYDGYEVCEDVSQCSSKIASLLIDIIPLKLEVLYISTSKLMKESRSTELERFVKQIRKASPRILQNYLILLQGRMAGAVAVNYAPTQSINVMIEFLLIFLTDIPKRFIHHDKLNDMLAHVGLLTRKISILVKESSENNINEADISASDLLQEIEQMKRDIRQIFLKAPELSQLCFPMDDGFLFMNLLLRHLNDLLISNAYSVSLIKKEIGMVKQSLEFIRSSFEKVKQTLNDTSQVVKDCWVRALNVAYEAEHAINSILVRDNALSHLIFSLPSVTDKIKLIVAQVTSLQLEDKNGDHPLDAKSFVEPIESTSSLFVEVTVGHEKEESKFIGQLLNQHESELDVISIVGMPGLGKTTLANKVYNNTLVASHFKIRAWCTVSQKYNKSKVLQEILQQVTSSEVKGREVDLAEKLRRALYDKRYLIVLDDVWDIATGEMLIACFPNLKRGDRVILTIQISKVGSQVKCRTDPIDLQVLTPEKSWELFEKRVFGEGSCPAELSNVGHQIVKKCKGLPLAIVLIAGVIVRGKKKEKNLWLKIQHNLDSFISTNINLQMMKVMQLSYDHLPCHLKPLLLYFARSQKNKRTPISKLKQLWMAEGFVDHDIRSKSSLEEATQSYLDALVSSSLIMVDQIPSKKSMPFSVRIKVCYVHDVVHDFCSEKSKKAKFFKLMNPGARYHASDYLHHRLTIHTDESQLNKKCVLFNSNKCSAGSKHLISLKVSGSLLNSAISAIQDPLDLLECCNWIALFWKIL
ncbi:hypothetical protein MTR67_016411 [Solanum verrucosum]|uniref:AAA+ ATPase domain-containing protein n=1 Tax=Solanum verrucosum TaxID=315347 RepID=A0AAF0QGT4_SOLVR|nr:hypothetical protein MTR67_016411 [Solanum verrucosum]